MPLTRSAVARSKVQDEASSSERNAETTDALSNGNMDKLPKTVKDASKEEPDSHLSTKTALGLLVVIFLASGLALFAVYYSFPHLEQ